LGCRHPAATPAIITNASLQIVLFMLAANSSRNREARVATIAHGTRREQ
jgi:hypothetical protein